MYGATREHAPSSTRLAGVLTAATATLAFGYAMANGMGAYIVQHIPDTLIYVPLPDKPLADLQPPPTSDLPLTPDTHDVVTPLRDTPLFVYDDATIIGTPPTANDRGPGPAIPAPPKPPAMVRTSPKLIPAPSPAYPPIDVRLKHQGTTSLEVCLDPRGGVTSARLASSSGYATLDQAALKWVRDRKFTPAKLDGQPEAVCGHPVSYEWRLDLR